MLGAGEELKPKSPSIFHSNTMYQVSFFALFCLFCLSVDGIWFHVVSGLFLVHVYIPPIALDRCFVQDHYRTAVL